MQDMPSDYYDSRHVLDFITDIAKLLLGVVLVIALVAVYSSTPLGEGRIASSVMVSLAAIVAFGVLIYRKYWIWRHDLIICLAKNGQLQLTQPTNLMIMRIGSSPDPFSLMNFSISTPRQSIVEAFFFRRSQTVILKGNGTVITLKHVKDADRLREIQNYLKGLERLGVEQNKEIIRQNNTMISLLQQIASHPEGQPPPQEDNDATSEIPVIPGWNGEQ